LAAIKNNFNKIEDVMKKIFERIGFDIPALIHDSLKSKLSDLKLAIDGKITETQAIKIRIIKSHYVVLTLCKSDFEKAIVEIAEPLKNQQELIQTIPGCAKQLKVIRILSEIGSDMSQFPTARNLCFWAGLSTTNNEN
jgi:transposase